MPPKLPKYVRHKKAKGRDYYYFDTGRKDERGTPILSPLPRRDDPNFGRALADAQAARTKRANTSTVLTLADLADLYEKSPKYRNLAKASQELYTLYLRRARAALGTAPADKLEPKHIRIVRDRMAETPSAANATVRAIGALYDWARRAGHVTAKPTEDVEELPEGEHEPWPDWLVEEALASDDDLVRRAVSLLYYTGQRIGDVVKLRKTDVHEGIITLMPQKTIRHRKVLDIPIHRDLKLVIEEAPANALTILARDNGDPIKRDSLRDHLQRWAKGFNVHIVPHGLRKNAINALLEAGCSVAEVQAITGQTLQMVEHYAKRRDRKHLATAAILRWEDAGNKSGKGKRK
jgi:integrase